MRLPYAGVHGSSHGYKRNLPVIYKHSKGRRNGLQLRNHLLELAVILFLNVPIGLVLLVDDIVVISA